MAYCLVVTDNEESTLLLICLTLSRFPLDILSQILYYKTQDVGKQCGL